MGCMTLRTRTQTRKRLCVLRWGNGVLHRAVLEGSSDTVRDSAEDELKTQWRNKAGLSSSIRREVVAAARTNGLCASPEICHRRGYENISTPSTSVDRGGVGRSWVAHLDVGMEGAEAHHDEMEKGKCVVKNYVGWKAQKRHLQNVNPALSFQAHHPVACNAVERDDAASFQKGKGKGKSGNVNDSRDRTKTGMARAGLRGLAGGVVRASSAITVCFTRSSKKAGQIRTQRW